MPFAFKYWGLNLGDSIYIDDYGSISVDTYYYEEISFLGEDMNSRGTGKSPLSYKVEGTAPNRIFKLEYRNVGFYGDLPGLADSANVQVWLYETTNVMEFRYGPNKVKTSTWSDAGAFVGIIDTTLSKYIILQKDPANPTINNNDFANLLTLNGMPVDGTIYKFTPSGNNGINKVAIKINIISNRIVLPASVKINSIDIYNVNGQILQSAMSTEDIDLAKFTHGLYLISIETQDGIITQKLIR